MYMEVTPIKKQYERDGKVQMIYPKYGHWINANKDGILMPEGSGKSPNSFDVDGYYVTLNKFDKLQYRLFNTRDGHMSDFVAFTKVEDEIFMVTMPISNFATKRSEINCNLAEKDRILNGFKQPNTIIVDEDRNHIYYANFHGKQVEDNFNLVTEDETLRRESNRLTMLRDIFNRSTILNLNRSDDKCPANEISVEDLEDFNIRLYGRIFSPIIDNYAIRFLSDTKVLCTGFNVTLKGKDNYRISLEETAIDLEKVYEQLQAKNAFKWNKEDCLADPNKKTLRMIEKRRQVLIANAEPAHKTTLISGHLIKKMHNLLDDREKE